MAVRLLAAALSPSRPVVGLSPDFLPARRWTKYTVYDRYATALRQAGALPIVLEPDASSIPEQLALVDGLLLPGGDDLDPALWGEASLDCLEPSDPRRSAYELGLARAAIAADRPLLGICLGLQTLNVACGGSVVQDLPPSAVRHLDREADLALRHDLELTPGSRLAEAFGRPEGGTISVNSFHHQAPGRIGEGLVVAGRAPDGVVEALEHATARFCLGVQWHPDADERDAVLFRAFVRACREARSAAG